jgi:hypothetical protein
MEYFLAIVVMFVTSYIGYLMAGNRGRSPVLWAALSFFFGLISLLVLAIMGKAKEKV